ncbi:AraC family transcriptional regulator [Yinghuangia sp. ASG 101]|uniref:AraC family transcriptional regulator n=1 Tax=Yinghuangia sp. ASG 101 TaxID=2896848 RepID=UPI001E532278|nr:AraC family transcriptional regulator [Yinghuangia sp. ASG 101]UGQ11309.1 AraC family transcriptional regulator [Yinghuangia sp. ASG 101]
MEENAESTAKAGDVVYAGDNPDRLHIVLNQAFTPHGMDLVGRRSLDADFTALHVGRIAAYDLSYGTDVEVTPVRPPEQYVIRIGHAGRASLDVQGDPTPFSPSVVSPGLVVTGRWDADTRTRFLCIPRRLVDQAVRTQTGEVPEKTVVFEAAMREDRPETGAWLHLARTFARTAANGALAQSPQAVAHFEQLLVHSLLAAQPHSMASALDRDRTHTYGPGPVRRAMTFCEENAHRPVSVGDIAAAARVGVRTLQAEFRRRLGITPMRYLRQVRLAGAHADLLGIAEGRATGTIAEVANRWGFPRRRYFTTMYERTYGCRPSDTVGEEP